jgi:hypothetical protein
MAASLDRDVGEEDLVHVDVRVLLDRHEDLLLDLLATVALDQLVVGGIVSVSVIRSRTIASCGSVP